MEEASEKKVEYLELIYDLIFVYVIGRNNALLHHFEGGFFSADTFWTFLVATLVILQVWYFSTLFINRYGNNGVSDHVALFVNMYLLYYLADGTRLDGSGYYYIRYNLAWGLILVNLAAQYRRKLRRSHGMMPWEDRHLKYHMRLLLIQAAVVFCSIPLHSVFHFPLSWLSLLVGFAAVALTSRIDALVPVNFEHLTERVMLYVVFSFGETIIAIAEYFEEGLSFRNFYFSLLAFLIVAALFLSYGFLYNHILDRERVTTGTLYMMVHIGLILSLSCITAALEFMREPEVSEIAKNIFLVAAFLAYYASLFFIGTYAKPEYRAEGKHLAVLIAVAAVFALAMALCYRSGFASIAVSVIFVYAVFGMIAARYRRSLE